MLRVVFPRYGLHEADDGVCQGRIARIRDDQKLVRILKIAAEIDPDDRLALAYRAAQAG